jgi:hypothetical protein
MLAVARRRGDVEWVAGTAASMAFDREFDLAVMTGHAFQVLVGDEELRASLTAIRRALADGGASGSRPATVAGPGSQPTRRVPRSSPSPAARPGLRGEQA